jgi:cytoskeleton-associated protein 5
MLKTLKWNFDVPRKEFIDQLSNQMEVAQFNRTLLFQMFHADFKYHIIALQSLTKSIDDLADATLSNLDLILRWLTLRFFETNPTVILKAIEYMQALFTMLANVKGYHLIDYEANAFIPYFIGKLGDSKDPIRKGFRGIIKQIVAVYAPVKIFNFLIQGLVSKNARQRTECLEELGEMIMAVGLDPFNPAVTLKEVAKQIGDRDNNVRSAALNTCTIAFQIVGEKVYKYVGKLNEKDLSMLEERIKRSAKSAPPMKSSQSGGIQQQQQQQPQKEQLNSAQNLPNSNSHPSLSSVATNGNGFNNEEKSTTMSNNGRQTPRSGNTPSKKGPQSQTQTIFPIQAVIKQRGEFHLDLADDDDEQNGTIPVKCTPHQDLDELLYQPIGLPPPRKNVNSYPVNILKESQDCREAIDLVITHISHQSIDISFQNLVQIDVVIKDKEKKDFLIPHIDNLLNTCSLKLNVAHNVYLNSRDCQVDEVFRLFKGLFTVIIDIFDFDLGIHTSIKTLKDVFNNLLCVMTDIKILNYPEGDQLIKAINIVTLKLLELSDQTTSYCALIKLLSECCDQENLSSKYLELVMKCIWRQIRRLSATNTNAAAVHAYESLVNQIDTSKVLQEIHLFLRMYPSSSWIGKPSDLPLRTVKTLLFHLAKAKQKQILNDLQSIGVPDDSEIKIYINKLFKNGFQLSNNSNNNTTTNVSQTANNSFGLTTTKRSQQPTSPEFKSNPVSRETSDQLSIIIKRIGNNETSKDGINELYDFKLQNPDIDLNKYFVKSSGKLQAYIQENLKLVEAERNAQIANKYNGSSSSSSSTGHFIKHNSQFKRSPESSSKTMSNGGGDGHSNRNVDDIMKTIADWKSKTHLNELNDYDNDENNIRSSTNSAFNNGVSRYHGGGGGTESSRLGNMHGGSNGRLFQSSSNNGSSYLPESENSIKAEKYLDIVKDLKKKYTRSRTESDQISDLKSLDLKAKNLSDNSASNTNLTQFQQSTANNIDSSSSNLPPAENLYDEYKRRLELIKKIKQVK